MRRLNYIYHPKSLRLKAGIDDMLLIQEKLAGGRRDGDSKGKDGGDGPGHRVSAMTAAGKTATLKAIAAELNAKAERPIAFYISMAPDSKSKDVYQSILKAYGDPYWFKGSESDLRAGSGNSDRVLMAISGFLPG